MIATESYTEYVTGYIHYFELPKFENGIARDSTFFTYVYNNTKGRLREELCFQHLMNSFIPENTNYVSQFEDFKKITSDKKMIADIEDKIKKYRYMEQSGAGQTQDPEKDW